MGPRFLFGVGGGVMVSYPIEIRRCGHIRTNGTQCGSPALKEKEFCYYHEQNQTLPVSLYLDGERYADSQIMIPPFEDAHSIQKVLRHVVQLLFERRIEQKDAGLALFALQIASSNLNRMQAEKAPPTQVVVEPEKVAETPMGRTPWSATGAGHDLEEPADIAAERAVCEMNEWWRARYRHERQWMMQAVKKVNGWMDGAANVRDENPRDILDWVSRNLERGAEAMGKQLEENEDLVRSEVEMVGNAT